MFMVQRPTFLSIICILMALYGIFVLIAGVALTAFGFTIAAAFSIGSIPVIGIGVGFIVLGLLTLLVVFLLWSGSSIGWYLAVVYLVINAIFGILSLPVGILSLLITILLIWYFFRPNVKDFFGV